MKMDEHQVRSLSNHIDGVRKKLRAGCPAPIEPLADLTTLNLQLFEFVMGMAPTYYLETYRAHVAHGFSAEVTYNTRLLIPDSNAPAGWTLISVHLNHKMPRLQHTVFLQTEMNLIVCDKAAPAEWSRWFEEQRGLNDYCKALLRLEHHVKRMNTYGQAARLWPGMRVLFGPHETAAHNWPREGTKRSAWPKFHKSSGYSEKYEPPAALEALQSTADSAVALMSLIYHDQNVLPSTQTHPVQYSELNNKAKQINGLLADYETDMAARRERLDAVWTWENP